MTTDEALTWIAEHKGTVDVYSGMYGDQNLRVEYVFADGVRLGWEVIVGMRSHTGTPHTAATALVECVEQLQRDSLKREHNGKATALAER